MSKGLWPCVTGTRIINLTNPEDVEDDERAQAIIMLNLDKTLIHHVDQLPTSKEKWDELDKLYGAKGKNSKISMKISLYALEFKPGVESLGAFISRMKGLMAQLASVQAPVDHEDAIAILLKSVKHVFPTLVTTLSNVPDLTWEGVIQSCLDEDKRHPAAPSTNEGASTSAPNQESFPGALDMNGSLEMLFFLERNLSHVPKACQQRAFRKKHLIRLHISRRVGKSPSAKLPSEIDPNYIYGRPGEQDEQMWKVMQHGFADEWIKLNLDHQHEFLQPYKSGKPRSCKELPWTCKATAIYFRNNPEFKPICKAPFKLSRFKNVPKKIDNYNPTPLIRD
ncbi:hypothetical protein L7F22_025877 [Adiantum nelumboides]|nr:hypothetical protein [Adiantum nelumboides]